MGNKLYIWLILNYSFIGSYHAFHGEWAKALYWIGAILITIAVVWMK